MFDAFRFWFTIVLNVVMVTMWLVIGTVVVVKWIAEAVAARRAHRPARVAKAPDPVRVHTPAAEPVPVVGLA